MILLKISSEANIRRLFDFGEIYFAPISYFKNVENNLFRGDQNEGLFSMTQAKNSKISIQLEGEESVSWLDGHNGELVGQVKISFPEVEEIGICSLLKARFENQMIIFNEDMRQFGSHAVAIYNPNEFYNRVLENVKNNGLLFESSNIEYVDGQKYSGNMGIFKKLREYEYQDEVRLVVYNRLAPFKIHIGQIHDISEIFEMDKTQVFMHPI